MYFVSIYLAVILSWEIVTKEEPLADYSKVLYTIFSNHFITDNEIHKKTLGKVIRKLQFMLVFFKLDMLNHLYTSV